MAAIRCLRKYCLTRTARSVNVFLATAQNRRRDRLSANWRPLWAVGPTDFRASGPEVIESRRGCAINADLLGTELQVRAVAVTVEMRTTAAPQSGVSRLARVRP